MSVAFHITMYTVLQQMAVVKQWLNYQARHLWVDQWNSWRALLHKPTSVLFRECLHTAI